MEIHRELRPEDYELKGRDIEIEPEDEERVAI